jgi:peptidyl-prolyl cis-trans isomerase A (cyclophilin A)
MSIARASTVLLLAASQPMGPPARDVPGPLAPTTSAAADVQSLPHVRIATPLGDIELAIDTVRAPVTGTNFLRYVDGRFFHGGRFVRTVRDDNQPNDAVRIAVVQAVIDRARAAEQFPAIPLERTSVTGLAHVDGAISMGRVGPDTAQSSFFICIGDQPALDFGGGRQPDGQGFAAFGRVVRGMDVVRRIHAAAATEQRLTPAIPIDSIVRVRAPSGASPRRAARSG